MGGGGLSLASLLGGVVGDLAGLVLAGSDEVADVVDEVGGSGARLVDETLCVLLDRLDVLVGRVERVRGKVARLVGEANESLLGFLGRLLALLGCLVGGLGRLLGSVVGSRLGLVNCVLGVGLAGAEKVTGGLLNVGDGV